MVLNSRPSSSQPTCSMSLGVFGAAQMGCERQWSGVGGVGQLGGAPNSWPGGVGVEQMGGTSSSQFEWGLGRWVGNINGVRKELVSGVRLHIRGRLEWVLD